MRQTWKEFRKDPFAVAGLFVVVAVVLIAAAAPLLATYDPNEQFFDGLTLEGSPLPPSARFWFGTDTLGRDQFSRVLLWRRHIAADRHARQRRRGADRHVAGVVAGYVKGVVGAAIMRFTDLMMAFPALLLGIALAAILKPSLFIVALVIALVNWVQIARVVYTETLALSERDFIEAARALGRQRRCASWSAICCRICCRPCSSTGTLGIATTVLFEATLSFLGVGVQPPTPSWGKMIFESQSYYLTAPWLVFIPGAAILVVALAFNLVGDGLRDALDPTQRGRR